MPASRLFDRAIIRLSPQSTQEDVAGFLQGLVTNDIMQGLPAYAGLLSAQGKTMFDFIVWPGGTGELLIDCEAARVDELVRRLTLYRLRRKIAIERDDGVAVHWQKQLGDGAAPDPRYAALGERWVAPATGEEARGADDEWRAHRLALGVAEGFDELGDLLWLETNAGDLNGVSFTKGCFIGQENTARMNWRQKVNRRLVIVPADGVEEKRIKTRHDDLGLVVAHLRVDDIPADAVPEWMRLEPGET